MAQFSFTLQASLSVKIFGNYVQYSRVTGKDNITKLLTNLNPIKIVKDFLSGQVRDTNILYFKVSLFLTQIMRCLVTMYFDGSWVD